MTNDKLDIQDVHWLMQSIQSIDIGVLAVDWDYNIKLWNRFMENHSGLQSREVIGKNIFEVFSEIDESWVRRKIDAVFLFKNRAYSTWEQREYFTRFKNYSPITGSADFMYQNVTFAPFTSADLIIRQVGILIYDVTDIAVSKIELENANIKLQHLSRTDRLTGLNNRGYWEECLVKEYKRASRSKQKHSLVMFDIDHFKIVNDTYGHQAGDEVIRVVSNTLLENLRETDIAGRYGGEEFCVILPETDEQGAVIFSERLRKKIEASPVSYEGMDIKYTISLGICELNDHVDGYMNWLECSDKALYESKEGGRNMTSVFSPKKCKKSEN